MRILLVPSGDIVNGTDLAPFNTLPRCERGLELFRSGRYDLILVTGGCFLPRHLQTEAAGSLMYRWFVEHGIRADQIVSETKSLDTFQNISMGMTALMAIDSGDQSSWQITVVTQWQHAWRFWISFKAMYGLTIKRESLYYPMGFKRWLKEFALIAYHLYDKKGVGAIAQHNRNQRQRAAQNP